MRRAKSLLFSVAVLAIVTVAFAAGAAADGTGTIGATLADYAPGAVTFALASGSVGCTVTSVGLVSITGAAVGTDQCKITATLAETANYLGGTDTEAFNIAKKLLTVTASDDQTAQYSDNTPTITFSYSNDFVSPDTAADIDRHRPARRTGRSATGG